MRILIAEDERITRLTLLRELQQWEHEVVVTEDGAQAWEKFQTQQFDLVVTDWDMPNVDGCELIQRIRKNNKAGYVYLIMLTGRSGKSDLVAGMEAGADDFLAKPFDRDELRVRLSAGERIINLERRLADQYDKLSVANERVHRDLRTAARIQQDLLPKILPQMGGLRFAWRYKPCEELGGDLLNVVSIGDSCAAMYLADVSGHGVAASLVSVSVHRSLSVRSDRSSLILSQDDLNGKDQPTPPDQVARRLNRLYPMSSNDNHFLTLVYATIDTESLQFGYCAAGHPGPVLARRGEAVRSLDTSGLPIGITPDPEYDVSTMQLISGDRIYLYSDALMEAGNPDGKMFGQRQIEETIDRFREMPIEESSDALVDAVKEWQRSDLFVDDLSLLVLEVP